MSTTAYFLIEYKDKAEQKWKRLKAYFPFKEEKWTHEYCGEIVEEKTTPKLLLNDGNGLSCFEELSYQGRIRDIFTVGYYDTGFKDRGLPSDISEDSKFFFDNWSAKIAAENEEYFKKYGVKRSWYFNNKCWWGESYATLDELNGFFETEMNSFRSSLEEAMKKKYFDTVMMQKMNEVLATIKGTKVRKKKNEELYADEEIEYLFEEKIYDIMHLNSFIATVSTLVGRFTNEYYNEKDIRVICYCC